MKKNTLVHLCLLKHQKRWLHHLHSLKDLLHSLSTFEDTQPFRHLRRPKRGESLPFRLSWLADANFLRSFEQSTIQPSCRIKNVLCFSSRFRNSTLQIKKQNRAEFPSSQLNVCKQRDHSLRRAICHLVKSGSPFQGYVSKRYLKNEIETGRKWWILRTSVSCVLK